MDRIDDILEHRQTLFYHYEHLLEAYVELPLWNANTTLKNGSYFPIILKSEAEKKLTKSLLAEAGIPSREYFSPSLNLIYKKEDFCPVSQSVASRVLCLPMHYYLSINNVKHIAGIIKRIKA